MGETFSLDEAVGPRAAAPVAKPKKTFSLEEATSAPSPKPQPAPPTAQVDPDTRPLAHDPSRAARAGGQEALTNLQQDWAAYQAERKQRPATVGGPLDQGGQILNRVPGDVWELAAHPVGEAVASALTLGGHGLSPTDARDTAAIIPAIAGYLGAKVKAPEAHVAPGVRRPIEAPPVKRVTPPELPPKPTLRSRAQRVEAQKNDMAVAQTLHRLRVNDGLTTEEMVEYLKKHPDNPAYHAGDTNMAGMNKALARIPGVHKRVLRQTAAAHQGEIEDQVTQHVGERLGGSGTYFTKLRERNEMRKRAANAGMAKFGHQEITLDQSAINSLKRPESLQALKERGQNLLEPREGETEQEAADRIDTATRLGHTIHKLESGDQGPVVITAREAQNASQALLRKADASFKGSNPNYDVGEMYKLAGQNLRNNARKPERGGLQEYHNWLEQYGSDSDNIDAFEMGRNAVKNTEANTADEIQHNLKNMAPAAAEHYREGIGEGLIYMVRSRGSGGFRTMSDLAKIPEFKAKVKIAFPKKEDYDAFMDFAETRAKEHRMNNAILSGSDTAENAAAMGDAATTTDRGAQMGHHIIKGLGMVAKAAGGNLAGVAKDAAGMAMERYLREERNILENPATREILTRAMVDPKEMARLLQEYDPEVPQPIFKVKMPFSKQPTAEDAAREFAKRPSVPPQP